MVLCRLVVLIIRIILRPVNYDGTYDVNYMPREEQLRCNEIIIQVNNDHNNNNNYDDTQLVCTITVSCTSVHSNIPNDGERIILFSLVYRMNLFDEKSFRLAHHEERQVVKNQIVRFDDSIGELNGIRTNQYDKENVYDIPYGKQHNVNIIIQGSVYRANQSQIDMSITY